MNAVYFFRNVDYQYSVTLNPVNILCACRPQLRRIAVLHLIFQNGQQLPRPLLSRLCDAVEEYNGNKRREGQRPRWGTHMTDANLTAIADMPTPDDLRRDADVTAKAKAAPKPSASPVTGPSRTVSSADTSYTAPTPKQTPQTPPWREGKAHGKGSGEPPPWREGKARGRGSGEPPPWRGGKGHGKSGGAPSHRGGDWNYTGRYQDNRGWR